MKNIKNLLNTQDEVHNLKVRMAKMLREMFPLEKDMDADGADTSGMSEWKLLQDIGTDEIVFEDCSLHDLIEVINVLEKYHEILA